jgi:hypothetical protein
MELLGVAIAAVIASAAWLYQRAWERQERRILRYQEILDRLPAFAEGNTDTEKKDEMITEIRRLWLSAPDDIVYSAESFLDSLEGVHSDNEKANSKEKNLSDLVSKMRQDATLRSAIVPRFWNTHLDGISFRLRHASGNRKR